MFATIFTIIFLILLVADVYIFFLYIKKLTKKTLLRILWFVPSLLLLAGLYYFFYSGIKPGHRDVFMIIFAAIALPKILFTVITLLDLPLRYFFKWKVYPFTVLALAVCVGIEFILIYGCTLGKSHFVVNEIEFSSPNLPASFDGYRIVQISDIHIGNWAGSKKPIEKLVEMVNSQKADAIMVTGDLVHNQASELEGYHPILSGLKAPDGVHSIMGNHDYGLYMRWGSKENQRKNLVELKMRQADLGWKMLNNAHTFLYRGNDSIALIGVENEGKPPFPQYGDLPKAMKGTEDTTFKLLLSHDPTHWRREVLDSGVDLMLAGHTHGTQFALGSFSFASFVYPEWGGMYKEGAQGLYVNVGIGHVGVPFRFGAWPEITVITLRKK